MIRVLVRAQFPEAAALSTELQAHYNICIIPQICCLYNQA